MLNFIPFLTGGTTTTATVDWSQLIDSNSFDGIVSGITTALPIVIPVVITIMGIPIVWKFVKGMIKKH